MPDGNAFDCYSGTLNKHVILPRKNFYVIHFKSTEGFILTRWTVEGNVHREITMYSINNEIRDTIYR